MTYAEKKPPSYALGKVLSKLIVGAIEDWDVMERVIQHVLGYLKECEKEDNALSSCLGFKNSRDDPKGLALQLNVTEQSETIFSSEGYCLADVLFEDYENSDYDPEVREMYLAALEATITTLRQRFVECKDKEVCHD